VDGFDVVPVGIEPERAVVALGVLGPRSRGKRPTVELTAAVEVTDPDRHVIDHDSAVRHDAEQYEILRLTSSGVEFRGRER
jgi:hypothetical protein